MHPGRNLFINGAFDVWQRGAAFVPALGTGVYGPDRWLARSGSSGPGVAAGTREDITGLLAGPDFKGRGSCQYSLKHDQTTGTNNGYARIGQRIENVRTGAGREITFTFAMRANAGLRVVPRLYQHFGSGGSTAVLVSGAAVQVSTDFTLYTATMEMPSVEGKTIGGGNYLWFWLEPETTDTFWLEIAGAQAELGRQATDFEHRPLAVEVPMCHRFFRALADGSAVQLLGIGWNVTTTNCQLTLDVSTMRAVPTLDFLGESFTKINHGLATATATSVSLGTPTDKSVGINVNQSTAPFTAGETGRVYMNSGACHLYLDAEL